jgi:hypothetical protein
MKEFAEICKDFLVRKTTEPIVYFCISLKNFNVNVSVNKYIIIKTTAVFCV